MTVHTDKQQNWIKHLCPSLFVIAQLSCSKTKANKRQDLSRKCQPEAEKRLQIMSSIRADTSTVQVVSKTAQFLIIYSYQDLVFVVVLAQEYKGLQY